MSNRNHIKSFAIYFVGFKLEMLLLCLTMIRITVLFEFETVVEVVVERPVAADLLLVLFQLLLFTTCNKTKPPVTRLETDLGVDSIKVVSKARNIKIAL